jgi:four helix bundle protein
MSTEKGAVAAFEDLAVFQKAYRVSLEIHQASLDFPPTKQYHGLAGQMCRASRSICANIAEGFGKQRQSKAEFARFLAMALGSADEMRVWLRYCLDLGLIQEAQWQMWRDAYQEIARMLQGLISAVRR